MAHHCITYDILLQTHLPHLANYPHYLPFIGNAWQVQKERVLFIAESHYLPEESNGKSDFKTWYDGTSKDLTTHDKEHINTRGVVQDADENGNYQKGYTIFYNIRNAILEAHRAPKSKKPMFQNFGYYNYFQRPAEITGVSIRNTLKDDQIAYNTIKTIVQLTEPTIIIFVSKRAHNSFQTKLNIHDKNTIFQKVKICQVPHPASAWWNKASKRYSNTNTPITGKTKFINIIKALDLNFKIES